jgi:hypothetical protein
MEVFVAMREASVSRVTMREEIDSDGWHNKKKKGGWWPIEMREMKEMCSVSLGWFLWVVLILIGL